MSCITFIFMFHIIEWIIRFLNRNQTYCNVNSVSPSPQRCCSLSATRWGTSQTCSRTRWPQQAPHRVAVLAPPHDLPLKPLKPPKLPRHQPLLPTRAPTLASPPPRHCRPSLYPSPLLSLPPRPPPPPPCPQGSSRWPAALRSFSHDLKWSSPSSLSPNRRPSPPSRYLTPFSHSNPVFDNNSQFTYSTISSTRIR